MALVGAHAGDVQHEPEQTQISPLRSFGAPVEMTKGRAALPGGVVAGQTFFIPLGGSTTHDFSGRDDKGEGGASGESSGWTDVFHPLGWVDGP